MTPDFEYTDRYQATGIPYPDVDTICQGQCEGTGYVPTKDVDAPDGWKFIKCPDCNGTGKRK